MQKGQFQTVNPFRLSAVWVLLTCTQNNPVKVICVGSNQTKAICSMAIIPNFPIFKDISEQGIFLADATNLFCTALGGDYNN